MSLALGAVIFLSLSAQIAVRLPFSPVPVTMQTLAVLTVGILYGSQRGALSILSYLAAGALGLPVFANGGAGLVYMCGPTGGYLMGFVFAAWSVGFLAQRGWDRKVWLTLFASIVGLICIFIFGLAWLALFVGADKVIALGLMPFIPGAIYKLALLSLTVPAGWKIIGKRR